MLLDTTCSKPCYLHGRLVALIETIIGVDKLPASFVSLCAPGHSNQSFFYWVGEAIKTGNAEIIEIAGKTDLKVPPVDDGSYWVGYNHQLEAAAKSRTHQPDNIRERIGSRLRELRTEKELSVRQLAEMAGVSYSNVVNIENARYSVGLDVLHRIATALGASIEIIKNAD